MGILDAFAAEDRVDVKFSTFYELVKGCAEREFITNGLKHKIPHAHILAMLGCCELLAGLAEEATELAQAALKMRRTLDKSNPTPMTTGDASRNLNEEFADVLLCAAVLGFDREEIARIIREKAARWSTRLEEGCDNV